MHFHYLFVTLFGWPAGIVLGNLLASVMWASLFEWRLRIHHRKLGELVKHAAHIQGTQDQAQDGGGVREKER